MGGFHVQPDQLKSHGTDVRAVGDAVTTGAQAELAGIQPADFGILIGPVIGTGLAVLGTMAAGAVAGVGTLLDDTGTQLGKTAEDYENHESVTLDLIRVVTA